MTVFCPVCGAQTATWPRCAQCTADWLEGTPLESLQRLLEILDTAAERCAAIHAGHQAMASFSPDALFLPADQWTTCSWGLRPREEQSTSKWAAPEVTGVHHEEIGRHTHGCHTGIC